MLCCIEGCTILNSMPSKKKLEKRRRDGEKIELWRARNKEARKGWMRKSSEQKLYRGIPGRTGHLAKKLMEENEALLP